MSDKQVIDGLKGDVKVWKEFVLVPHNTKLHWTFFFCGSCTGYWDDTENAKYIKYAVLCAMSYRIANCAIYNKEWIKAKYHLWRYACNYWTLQKSTNKTLAERFEGYEKWIQIALKLPFDKYDEKHIDLQCKLLRSYAFYMMNVYGDKYKKLGDIYETIMAINQYDPITLTYYGLFLYKINLFKNHNFDQAINHLKKATAFTHQTAVFLNDTTDDNIKSVRFGEPIYAENLLKMITKHAESL